MKNITRKVLFCLGITLGIIVLPIVSLVGLWLVVCAIEAMPPYPALPENTSGEFPFELTYEINGEMITVNDSLMCKFDMYYGDFHNSKAVAWSSYLKSDESKDEVLIAETDGVKFFCSVGSAGYYMGEYDDNYEASPNVYSVQEHKLGGTLTHFFQSEEELYEQYGIRIISYEFSPPIENTFSKNIFCYFPFGPEIYKIIKN